MLCYTAPITLVNHESCPKLIGIGIGSGRSGADPFVIALALCNDGVVVTDESPKHPSVLRRPQVSRRG